MSYRLMMHMVHEERQWRQSKGLNMNSNETENVGTIYVIVVVPLILGGMFA